MGETVRSRVEGRLGSVDGKDVARTCCDVGMVIAWWDGRTVGRSVGSEDGVAVGTSAVGL